MDERLLWAEVHPKAMPVNLELATKVDEWLDSEANAALELRRQLPVGRLLNG